MPTLSQFMAYILRIMQDGEVRHTRAIVPLVRELAQLTEAQMTAVFPVGGIVVLKRIRWGCWYFLQAGIFNKTAPATYQITALGREKAVEWQNLEAIPLALFNGLPLWDAYQQALEERRAALNDETAPTAIEHESPDIIAWQAVQQIEAATALELLTRLRQESPEFFEKTVIRVLLAMGYGGRENLFEHLGRSHDGGIDGVIRQDPLGIQKIYIQAKRYAEGSNIGSEAIQSFAGALQGHGMERGVFITTSAFTAPAQEYAARLLGKIILIDGNELASLMIRYKVGIQTKQTLEIVQLDEDFFESF